jgi:hypothetical protein
MEELDIALARYDGAVDHEDTKRFEFNARTEDASAPTEAMEASKLTPPNSTLLSGAFANTSQISSSILPPPRLDTPNTAPMTPAPKVEVFDAENTSPTTREPRAPQGPESGDFDRAVMRLQAARKRNALIAAAIVGIVIVGGVAVAMMRPTDELQSENTTVKTIDTKPIETKPIETKPAEAPPVVEEKPVEEKLEEKPVEHVEAAKPADTKSAEKSTTTKKKTTTTKGRTKDADGFIRVRTDGK